MKVAFDLDEVLADFNSKLLQFHNENYGTNFAVSDLHSYNLWETWGGTREQAIQKVFRFYESPYFENIKPFDEAIGIIEKLSKNNELVIITSRPTQLESVTTDWVHIFFPQKFSKILLTHHYSNDGKIGKEKDEVCSQESIDVIVEDSLEWAQKCSRRNVKAILLDRPWNQTGPANENIIRVEHLNEILGIL